MNRPRRGVFGLLVVAVLTVPALSGCGDAATDGSAADDTAVAQVERVLRSADAALSDGEAAVAEDGAGLSRR